MNKSLFDFQYGVAFLIGIGLILTGVSLSLSEGRTNKLKNQVDKLEQQVASLKKEISEREDKIEKGLVDIQEVLNIHQQANEEQAKVNQSFLRFMKLVNGEKN